VPPATPEPKPVAARRYVVVFVAALVAILALAGTTTAVLDPFGLHRWLAIDGINVAKPATHTRVRLFKAYEVERVQPQTLVLGSSRSHVGFSCRHVALGRLAPPCYNLAFDGATTREMYAYLVHANEVRPLRAVLLGLDSYHLSEATSATRPGFDPAVLLSPAHPAWRRTIEGDIRLAIGADTLRASVDMLGHQRDGEPEWFAADGQRLGEAFFHREGETFVRAGPRAYFDEIDRLEVGFQLPPPEPARARVDDAPPDPAESSLAYVGRIVAFCRAHAIDLRIAITPSHVHQLEIAAMLGAEGAAERGKRALVAMLSRDAANADAVPVWDFSGVSSITTEPLPPHGSRDEMAFYWDSSHFKSTVGDLVLDRVFETASAARPLPADFGVRLDADTIEPVLAMERARHAAHRERADDDLAALRALVDAAAKRPLP
jgi:hypothetical protein